MEYYHCSSDADQAVAATFKVLVLGNSNVGKTSLIKSYSTKKRPGNMMPTIGVDYTDVVVTVRGTAVKLRIWDTAGQEKFYTFTKQFFRGTQGVLLVYDITAMDSFRTLQKWNKTLREEGLDDVSVVIVGNKADLEEMRVVPTEAATQFASQHYKTQHIETSVHRGTNVKRAFHMLAENLIFSHNIFRPGEEATAKDESCGNVYNSSSMTGLEARTDSIKLGDASKFQPHSDRKCCLTS